MNAGKFHKAEVVILGGDMTGKAVVPLVKQADGATTSDFLGMKTILKSNEEVKAHERTIVDTGFYPYHTTPREIAELSKNSSKANQILENLMIQRVKDWVEIAQKNLKASGIRFIVTPGNDDSPAIDPILDASEVIERVEGKVLDIDGHEMINSGFTNPTPWNTPRECSEEELRKKIDSMVLQVRNLENSIFQLHAPPYGIGLDDAPILDKDMKPVRAGAISGPAGSKAVYEAIQQHQPLVGLHGHIHESRGVRKVGRTLCFNPGSMYSEGMLQGLLITLEKNKVKAHVFISG